jgi:DNA-binding transcriptional ArsR family regulator
MRPLVHPSIDDICVEGILHALSDPVRASIYAGIVLSECPLSCSDFLDVSETPIPKSTLSQHFKALREAGLIRSERRGIEMHNVSRCDDLAKRFPGLIPAILKAYKQQAQARVPARRRASGAR